MTVRSSMRSRFGDKVGLAHVPRFQAADSENAKWRSCTSQSMMQTDPDHCKVVCRRFTMILFGRKARIHGVTIA
jgi:hypothetical protein